METNLHFLLKQYYNVNLLNGEINYTKKIGIYVYDKKKKFANEFNIARIILIKRDHIVLYLSLWSQNMIPVCKTLLIFFFFISIYFDIKSSKYSIGYFLSQNMIPCVQNFVGSVTYIIL